MNERSGAQISKKVFVQSMIILFALMCISGITTKLIPAGEYSRVDQLGREIIDPASFRYVENPDYPV